MSENWKSDLERWLAPFVCALRHKTRARMCPAYIAGLIGAGDRKSVQPMAARDDEVGYDQLHHFIAIGVWDVAPLEKALLAEADRMVGGANSWLIIDDTALPKKGVCSVGVAPQYASSLGKTANCQSMVSLTLASYEVLVMVGLRLFLPESWTSDPRRMAQARVPEDRWTALSNPECQSALNFGSDSLLMQSKRRLTLVSPGNQRYEEITATFGNCSAGVSSRWDFG